MRRWSAILFFLVTVGSANAGTAYDQCFDAAAKKYSVDVLLLKAIAKTESGFNPYVISDYNSNGSYDIGMMQINSSWLPKLSRYGITQSHLLSACTNIHVGAWILASNIHQVGRNWRAVGAYNSPTEKNQQRYAHLVWNNYLKLSSGR